jgi:hypothetical protein
LQTPGILELLSANEIRMSDDLKSAECLYIQIRILVLTGDQMKRNIALTVLERNRATGAVPRKEVIVEIIDTEEQFLAVIINGLAIPVSGREGPPIQLPEFVNGSVVYEAAEWIVLTFVDALLNIFTVENGSKSRGIMSDNGIFSIHLNHPPGSTFLAGSSFTF